MSTYSGVEGSPPSFGELLRNKDLYRLDETVYGNLNLKMSFKCIISVIDVSCRTCFLLYIMYIFFVQMKVAISALKYRLLYCQGKLLVTLACTVQNIFSSLLIIAYLHPWREGTTADRLGWWSWLPFTSLTTLY